MTSATGGRPEVAGVPGKTTLTSQLDSASPGRRGAPATGAVGKATAPELEPASLRRADDGMSGHTETGPRTVTNPSLYTTGRLFEELARVIDEIRTSGSTAALQAERDLIADTLRGRTMTIEVTIKQLDSTMDRDDVHCVVQGDNRGQRTETKRGDFGETVWFVLSAYSLIGGDSLRGSLWIEAHNERLIGESFVTGLHWHQPFAKHKETGGGEGRGTYTVAVHFEPR